MSVFTDTYGMLKATEAKLLASGGAMVEPRIEYAAVISFTLQAAERHTISEHEPAIQ